ncbi:hypothetical protein [Nocardia jiangsuensis]|uniref:Excreted virulence factor EspC (Type VII ESX diderm) n=1 Tax=Nocardia jiangsuensis TaxID=1691563 RepID=A0ABV8DNR3_9NOCA
MLTADILQLNRLADTVGTVSAEIDKIDVRTSADRIPNALPGCTVGQACVQSGEFIEGAWLRMAQRLHQLETIVRQCSASIHTTETEFTDRLNSMDFRASSER